MRHILLGLIIILLSSIFFLARGQETYKLWGKAYKVEWLNGKWNGKHTFPSVYCTTFPTPEDAKYLSYAFFNGGGIYLVNVPYSNGLIATIVVSTVPPNQTTEEAFEKILANEHRNEAQLKEMGIGYTVNESSGDFGRTLSIIAKNASIGSENGPFPLERSFIANPQQSIKTLSVHRLFVRGHDRFEVAVIQGAPEPATSVTEAVMTTQLTAMVDEIVKSLQECTASMPIRTPK